MEYLFGTSSGYECKTKIVFRVLHEGALNLQPKHSTSSTAWFEFMFAPEISGWRASATSARAFIRLLSDRP